MSKITIALGWILGAGIALPISIGLAHWIECSLLNPPYLYGECHDR